MEGHLSLQDRVFRGSLLVCIWASLRFNDAQHVFCDKILLDNTSLRAACFQAKSSKTGYPFAVQCLGLISESHQSSWLLKWLEALNEIWDASVERFGPSFIPDHLFPLLDASGAILEPMSYAQTKDGISNRFPVFSLALVSTLFTRPKQLCCHGLVSCISTPIVVHCRDTIKCP